MMIGDAGYVATLEEDEKGKFNSSVAVVVVVVVAVAVVVVSSDFAT